MDSSFFLGHLYDEIFHPMSKVYNVVSSILGVNCGVVVL
jgi:hypothetical protein